MPSLIELRHITKTYQMGSEQYQALKDINFTMQAGELVAIVGESGAGKTTLLSIVGLLDRPTAGEYLFGDKPIESYDDEELSDLRGQKIGFVFQSFCLLPRLTAAQNIALPLLYRNISFKEAYKKVVDRMNHLGIGHLADHKPNQMSGGQQQRVAITRALIGDPELILADEPTGALDSKTSDEVTNLFIELNEKEKKTILIITHNRKIAERCHRMLHIADGCMSVEKP